MRVGRANGGEWMRLAEAAAALGVSHNTLRHWSDEGRLTCYRSPGGHRRYRRADIDAALAAAAAHEPAAASASGPQSDQRWEYAALQALAGVAAQGSAATSCCIALRDGDDALRVVAAHPPGHGLGDVGTCLPLAAHAAEAEVLGSRRRLVIPDLSASSVLPPEAAREYQSRGLTALLVLPILVAGRADGVLCLGDSRGPRGFTAAVVTFAEFMARHAGLLVAGEHAGHPTDARGGLPHKDESATPAGLATFADLVAGTNAGTTAAPPVQPPAAPQAGEVEVAALHEGLRRAAEPALAALDGRAGVSGCALYGLRDGRARVLAARGTGALLEEWALDSYPAAALAAEGGGPAITVAQDAGGPAADASQRFLAGRGLEAALLVPVVTNGRTTALLEVGGTGRDRIRDVAPAAEGVVAVLSAAAETDAEAVRLHRRIDELSGVVEAGLVDTSRLGTQEALRTVVRQLAALTRAPIAEVYAVEGETYRAVASLDNGQFDTDWEGVVLPLARYAVSRRAVESEQPVVIAGLDDPSLDDQGRFSLEKWGYQAVVSVPLLVAGRVVGLVELTDYVPHDFLSDLALIRALARVAAHVLETELTLEEAGQRARVMEELVTIGGDSADPPHVDELLHATARRLQQTVDAASCDIFRVSGQTVRCAVSHDRSGFDESRVGESLDLTRSPSIVGAMNAHEVLVVAEPEDPRLSDAERLTYREYGFASEVCIPLAVHGHLYGFIDIYDTRRRGYAEYLAFLRATGHLLSLALENAEQAEVLEHRSRAVREIAELGELGARAADQIDRLAEVAEKIRATLGAADCDIFSLRDGLISCLVSVDAAGVDPTASGNPLDVDRYPVTALALRSGEVLSVRDLDDPRLTDEERRMMEQWGYRSELCIPLRCGGGVTGLIDVFDSRPRDYAPLHEYLDVLGVVAAAVVENVLLSGDLETQSSRSAVFAGICRDVASAGTPGQVTQAVCEPARRALGAAACHVYWVTGNRECVALTQAGMSGRAGETGVGAGIPAPDAALRALQSRQPVRAEAPGPAAGHAGIAMRLGTVIPEEVWVPVLVHGRGAALLHLTGGHGRRLRGALDFLDGVATVMGGALERLDGGAADTPGGPDGEQPGDPAG